MNNKHFLLAAAICSFLGALTTGLLIFLPASDGEGMQNSVLLYQDVMYKWKLWILFIHPQLNFIACLGLACLLIRKYPLEIIIGSFFLLVWAYTEMSQQALLIDALNQYWRPGFLGAQDAMSRNVFLTLIKGTDALSDSKYFLLLYGFGIGTLLFGIALVREAGLARWLGIGMVFIGLLSLCSFIRYYLGVTELSTIVDWVYEWIYSYLQPLVRIGIGFWILSSLHPGSAVGILDKSDTD